VLLILTEATVTESPGPIFEDIAVSYNELTYNGTFTTENIYRQLAALEVDEAWEALGVNCEFLCQYHVACRLSDM
jgi:hypothetical protein